MKCLKEGAYKYLMKDYYKIPISQHNEQNQLNISSFAIENNVKYLFV
jgi:hypothetical protein